MDTIWAATITTEGEIAMLTEKPTYEVLRDAVGGMIAPVTAPHGDTVYVNDEGDHLPLSAPVVKFLRRLAA